MRPRTLSKPTIPIKCPSTPYIPPVSEQHVGPNTLIHYPVYTEHSIPIPAGQLKYDGWRNLMTTFPDRQVGDAILGICLFGARIGYQGARDSTTIYPNLISVRPFWLLITCVYSHAGRIRNAPTIICYTRFLKDSSTTVSSNNLQLQPRIATSNTSPYDTETGTLTITEHYPQLHTQPAAGRPTIPSATLIEPRR